MINRRLLLGGATAAVAQVLLSNAQAQNRAQRFKHDIPELSTKNWEVNVLEVSYAPGGSSGAHRHPGITIVYVLEGEVVSKVSDGPETTYKPGDVFMETPNQLHGVSRNASSTKPAKILAVMLSEKGKDLTTPA